MPTTLKLSKREQEDLRKKAIEINKVLIKMEKMPLQESDIAHFILGKTIACVQVNKSGEVVIDMD